MPFDSISFVPTDPVLKCLEDARQWLSEPGHWCHNDGGSAGENERGGLCAVRSVGRFSGGRLWLTEQARDALTAAMPAGHFNVAGYNDNPTTTHADILALFDSAIAARKAELLQSVEA